MNRRAWISEPAADPVVRGGGHWTAGQRLEAHGVVYARGATVPDAIVEALAPTRIDIFIRGGVLVHRPGPAPKGAPAPAKVVREPDTRQAVRENMVRDGYEEYELDAKAPPRPGMYKSSPPLAAVSAEAPTVRFADLSAAQIDEMKSKGWSDAEIARLRKARGFPDAPVTRAAAPYVPTVGMSASYQQRSGAENGPIEPI